MKKTAPIILFFIFRALILTPVFAQGANDESRSVRILGFQMDIYSDIQKNKEIIIKAIQKAGQEGADFLMTPEGSLSGYNSIFPAEELKVALEEVLEASKKSEVGLILGTCYKDEIEGEEKCWNQIRTYAPSGKLLSAYSKILRCSPVDIPGTGEMLEYEQGQLETFEWKGITFGSLVCNDLWATPGYTTIPNPYLALKLKQMGAEVILHAINSGSDLKYKPFHESSAELWASSLGIQILEVNAAKGNNPLNAVSGLIDVNGKRKLEVSDVGQQFFLVEIDKVLNTDGY